MRLPQVQGFNANNLLAQFDAGQKQGQQVVARNNLAEIAGMIENGGDIRGAAVRALGAGLPQANALFNLAHGDRSHEFRVNEAERSQGNFDKRFDAGRDDALFSRGMAERRYAAGRDDAAFNRDRALKADARRAAAGRKVGMRPVYGRDETGKIVVMQLAPDGRAVRTNLPDGVQPLDRIMKVDTGTGTALVGRGGNVVNTIDKRVGEAEAAKVAGKKRAEKAATAPETLASFGTVLGNIDSLVNDPDLGRATGLIGSNVARVPGTPAFDVAQKIKQLQGGAFLQAFESLKGGGQITEVEGQKAENAIARLNNAQSYDAFVQALREFRSVVAGAKARLERSQGAAVFEGTTPGGVRFKVK